MKSLQRGAIDPGMVITLISGLIIGGLFVHSYATGEELPIWPAIAVICVNLFGVWRTLKDVQARRRMHDAARQQRDPEQ